MYAVYRGNGRFEVKNICGWGDLGTKNIHTHNSTVTVWLYRFWDGCVFLISTILTFIQRAIVIVLRHGRLYYILKHLKQLSDGGYCVLSETLDTAARKKTIHASYRFVAIFHHWIFILFYWCFTIVYAMRMNFWDPVN